MQQHDLTGNETRQPWESPGYRSIFRFDALLLVFLPVSFLLIFGVATLGMQRSTQQWLPVKLISRLAANYSVDTIQAPKLAHVKPEIIEAVKQDAQVAKASPRPVAAIIAKATPTSTLEPTSTAGPRSFELRVSAGGPYKGDEGSPIFLVVQDVGLIRLVPGSVTYRWDLDDDGLYDDAEGAVASVVFFDEGEYTVGIRVTDLIGRVATDTATVSVSNVPPIVDIRADQSSREGEDVEFLAFASDPGHDVLLYEWDFGDGSTRVHNTLHPTHTYEDDGDYRVRLRVQDNDGGVTEKSLLVEVDNLPPVVYAGTDQITNEGNPVAFRGRATDPAGDRDPLSYAWDFDYDGRTFTPDAFGPTASTVYADGPATLVAALRVQDDDGGQAISTVRVTVNNVAPTIATVTNNGPKGEGTPLTLAVNAIDVEGDTLSYAFDWENDGKIDAVDQPGRVSHIWYNQGKYTVGIRADDEDGGQSFTTTIVSIFNLTPTAVAQSSGPAVEGSTMVFNGGDSSDPGINDILTYQWNFGDGSTAGGLETTHVYTDNGVYSATLTVTDDSGAADVDSIALNILNANPVADAGPDLEIDEGIDVPLTFNGAATDPGADELSYAWDFDYDGSFNEEATGASVIQTFSELDGPAEYLVALRVRDDDYPYPTGDGGEIGEHIDTLKLTVKNVPPTNVDARGPYSGIAGQAVVLTASNADDVPGDTLTYQWDLDYNGATFAADAAGQTVTKTWSTAGVYTVSLRVADEDGGESFDTAIVNINAIPVAAVVVSPTIALEGENVTFDGSGSSDPDNDSLTYGWNFGDGTPVASGITVTHAYPDNGVYTATLTVRDADGAVDTDSAAVTILNANPIVEAGSDRMANEGVQITLAGTATDPGTADVLTYTWDFNYDGSNFDEDATGPSINVTYLDGPATFTVALRVRDDDYPYPTGGGGEIGEDTDTLQVTVNNLPPIANAGGPYSGVEGQPVTLTGTAADVPIDTLIYEWDLNYDGATFTPDLTGQSVAYTWNTGGVYTVALRVIDKDGGVGIDTAPVNIDSTPTAQAGGPYSGDEGFAITFDGSGSTDPDGDSLTYAWSFGDGSPSANGISVTHIYADGGVFTATLQVDDGRGGIATDNALVTVNNLPPTAGAGPDQTVLEGELVTFSGTATDPGADTFTFEWDFDYDGATFNVDATGQNVSPSFPDGPAVYTVALRVRDDDGGVGFDTALVTVNNVPPTASAGGPYTTTVGVTVTLTANATDVVSDTLAYAWDLDNDGTFETPGPVVTSTWITTGTYTVVLKVDDGDGGVTTDTTTVQVSSLVPFAWLGTPYFLTRGKKVVARRKRRFRKSNRSDNH